MMSSTTPSAKYSCSASPLMFWNGRTAIEGFSGRASAVGPAAAALYSRESGDFGCAECSVSIANTRIRSAMFLSWMWPRSLNARSGRAFTWRYASSDKQIPPGSATL